MRLLLVILLVLAMGGGCAHRRVASKEPDAGEVIRMRQQIAEALIARKEYDQAARYLRDLIAASPGQARLHHLLGVVLREKGVLDVAEAELRRALALQPDAADSHSALGVLRLKQRRFAEAERHHRRAVELRPGDARLHNDLGFCLMVARRLPQALEALKRAIQLDPTLRRAFNNLGFVLGLMGEREAAWKAFSQAGSQAMAHTNMGYLEELRGNPGRARWHYERALRKDRSYAPALHNLRTLEPGAASEGQGNGGEDDDEEAEPSAVPADRAARPPAPELLQR